MLQPTRLHCSYTMNYAVPFPATHVSAYTTPPDSTHLAIRLPTLKVSGIPLSTAHALVDIDHDLHELMLHARRLNLLRKCVAECDAVPASPRLPPSRWSASSGTPDSLLEDVCEPPYDVARTSSQPVDAGNFAQYRPPTRSDSDSSSLDTQWATPAGLVPEERLFLVHAGALAIEDLIPPRLHALAPAGWRQIGDLYMTVVASQTARARRGSLADTDTIDCARAKAAHMYRIADEVQLVEESASEPESPQLYAPVPVHARRAGEPSAVEWLHEVAELRLEYLEQCRAAEGSSLPLRARSIQEELEMMEYWFRIHWMGDSSWSPRF